MRNTSLLSFPSRRITSIDFEHTHIVSIRGSYDLNSSTATQNRVTHAIMVVDHVNS